MIETVYKGLPDTVAHAVAIITTAAAAVAEQLPPGLLNGVGVIGLVVFMYFALARGWIVTRREHEDMREQRNYAQGEVEKWQGIAFKALGVSEKVTDAAEVLAAAPSEETT